MYTTCTSLPHSSVLLLFPSTTHISLTPFIFLYRASNLPHSINHIHLPPLPPSPHSPRLPSAHQTATYRRTSLSTHVYVARSLLRHWKPPNPLPLLPSPSATHIIIPQLSSARLFLSPTTPSHFLNYLYPVSILRAPRFGVVEG